MHRAAAVHCKTSSEFNYKNYRHSLIVSKDSPSLPSPNRYASYFQTLHKSQGPQSTGLSAQRLIRMVLYTATLKDYHYKPVLHDEQGLFLIRPLYFINLHMLNKGNK